MFIVSVLFGSMISASAWEVLEGVRLTQSRSNDGDSFRALYQGREYIFRLYGADCPETDSSFPDRVRDQATDFGVPTEAIVEWGHRANSHTQEMLRSPFRVVTQWEDAMGRSNLPRHYAYVLPAGGGDLSANLISQGLARARGKTPPLPVGFPRVARAEEYQKIQSQAKSSGSGAWGASSLSSSRKTDPSGQEPPHLKVNVNTAQKYELESLPGIGPVLAARIMESRPHRSESDLLRVSGLGLSRLNQIRALVTF